MHYKTEIDINYIISFTLSDKRPLQVINIIEKIKSLNKEAVIEFYYLSTNWTILVSGKHAPLDTSRLLLELKPVVDNNIIVIEK